MREVVCFFGRSLRIRNFWQLPVRLPSLAWPVWRSQDWHGSERSFHISFGIVLVTPRRAATLIPCQGTFAIMYQAGRRDVSREYLHMHFRLEMQFVMSLVLWH